MLLTLHTDHAAYTLNGNFVVINAGADLEMLKGEQVWKDFQTSVQGFFFDVVWVFSSTLSNQAWTVLVMSHSKTLSSVFAGLLL